MTQVSLPTTRLLEILERQGYRELVSAHLFATGVRAAPSIDDKHMLVEHAGEELAHFEVVAALYEELSGKTLYDAVVARAEAVPVPASWLEVAVAAYLVDRAAAVQLAAYENLSDPQLDRLIHKILDHEHEHQTAAETALRDQCHGDGARLAHAQQLVDRWYPLARATLDEPGPTSATASAFTQSVQPTLRTCGLSLK
jgi:1,2-phenylacetyl-CoA epoxidase catalytic subunit